MKKWSSSVKWVGLVIFVGLMLISCGGAQNTNSDISGVWKSEDGESVLKINFNGETKTIEMDGKIMPATIESDTDKQMVVKVQEDADKVSTWTLKKIWNDNGSSFTFNLTLPDGTFEHYAMEKSS